MTGVQTCALPIFINDEFNNAKLIVGGLTDITQRKSSEKELKDSWTMFNNMLDVVPDMISIHDNEMNIIYSNWNGFANVPLEKRKFGTKCYKTYRNYGSICPDCQAKIVLESKTNFEKEVELPDGSWFDIRVIPIPNSAGEFEHFMEWVRDITDKKHSEQALRESEEKFRNLFDNSALAVGIRSLDGHYIEFNDAYLKMLGYEKDEIKGLLTFDITHPEDVIISKTNMDMIKSGESELQRYEKRYIGKNGKIVWGDVCIKPIKDKDGKPFAIIGAVVDITERKKIEENLRLKSLVLNQIQDLVTITDLDGNIIDVNEAELYLLGYSIEELIGSSIFKYGQNPEKGASQVDILQLTKERGFWRGEVVNYTSTGKEVILDCRTSVIYDLKNKPIALCGISTDITERKRAEERLAFSHYLMQYVIQNARSAIAVHDKDLRYIYVSERYLKEYNVKEKDIIGKHHYDVFPDLPEKWRIVHQKALQGIISSAEDDPYYRDDGTVEWTRWECRPWYDMDGKIGGIIVYTEVITHIKEAELELIKAKERAEQSESHLKQISNNISNAMIYQVVALDKTSRKFTYLSDAVAEFYGCSAEDGMNNADLIYSKVNKDDVQRLINEELEAWKKMSVLKTEVRIYKPDGGIRWSKIVSTPKLVKDLVFWDGIEFDITEQKRIEEELKSAKERAEQSDKLKTSFLQNMSHEIRTPLNGIIGFSTLLKDFDNLTRSEKVEFIELIISSSERLLAIVTDVLEISRIDSGILKVNISEFAISEMVSYLSNLFALKITSKGLNFVTNIPQELKKLRLITDKDKLYQIVSNFITNAIKFTQTGEIDLSLQKVDDGISINIRDTGIGIEEHYKTKIFERFWQYEAFSKNIYGGTGLGLSISKGLADALGLEIKVQSKIDQGSVFSVIIPENLIIKDEFDLIAGKSVNAEDSLNLGNLRFLIVEDDDINYRYLSRLLQNQNLQIEWVSNGLKATEIVEKQKFDLIFMDLKMPVMDGFQATKIIKSKYPDIPVIAQTAYSQPEEVSRAKDAGCDGFISKPINPKDFFDIIKKVLIK